LNLQGGKGHRQGGDVEHAAAAAGVFGLVAVEHEEFAGRRGAAPMTLSTAKSFALFRDAQGVS